MLLPEKQFPCSPDLPRFRAGWPRHFPIVRWRVSGPNAPIRDRAGGPECRGHGEASRKSCCRALANGNTTEKASAVATGVLVTRLHCSGVATSVAL